MRNTEGDELLFGEAAFKVSDRDSLLLRLDNHQDFIRDGDEPPFWSWLGEEMSSFKGQAKDEFVIGSQEDGRVCLAQLTFSGDKLTLSANSKERMELCIESLKDILDGIISGTPLVAYQTLEQLQKEIDSSDMEASGNELREIIGDEEYLKMIHDMLDKHYQGILDSPIPVLNDLSPREAARSCENRHLVIDWLKKLENSEEKRARKDNLTVYSVQWIWEELRLVSERVHEPEY